jgi:serine/threonine protein kinase
MTADQNPETMAYSAGPVVTEVLAVPANPMVDGQFVPLFDVFESVADDRYQITQPMSLSRLSEVYRATDWRDKSVGAVALKVFHEPDAAASRRVGRELQAHLLLDGLPGIVSFRDAGVLEKDDQSYRYLATRFAEGGTLANHIEQDPNNVELVRSMASQILPALGLMHDQGVIHRDVKPDNILVDEGGNAFELTDFGIVDLDRFKDMGRAALHDGEAPVDSAIETPIDRISGTPGFIAPEAFDLDEPIGPEVDVFAMGVVLFQGMTGKLPFASGKIHEYRVAVTNESPVPIRSLNRRIPEALEELTMESLRKDPHDRPRIDELEARLQAV